eukprot:1182248-Prorocentrum_minimum.AAC.4
MVRVRMSGVCRVFPLRPPIGRFGRRDVTSPRRRNGGNVLVRPPVTPVASSSDPPRILPVRSSQAQILAAASSDPHGLSGVAAPRGLGAPLVAASAHLRTHFRRPFGALRRFPERW